MGFTFCCAADNDLYSVLAEQGHKYLRYDTPAETIEKADPGSAVLILADNYPIQSVDIAPELLDLAARKRLKVYIEYPAAISGIEIGMPQHTVWERTVVSSDAFGEALPKLRILQIHDCHYVPVKAPEPLLVVARVAGYDTAVYGLPEETFPILFEISDRNILVATTKLSGFVTGRYAPTKDWKIIWEHILAILSPEYSPRVIWKPKVHPAYGQNDPLPQDVEKRALELVSEWYTKSRLLIHPSRRPEIDRLLRNTNEEVVPIIGPDAPIGDGSQGILEGYASGIRWDGNQVQRVPIRSDCNAEVAMALALDWAAGENSRSRELAENIFDFVWFTSGMHGGVRGNPRHPAFGMVAWGIVSPAWEIANYGDDDARVILSAVIGAAYLGSEKWDKSILTALLANLRTTGPLGFRGERIDIPDLERNGWKHYYDTPTVHYSPHFESYLWACYLWAYQQTKHAPFLEKTKTAIRMMMEAYPDQWAWGNTIELARMLLCLAWLVRVADTTEHRGWLMTIADALLAYQQPSGAIRECLRVREGFFAAPASNEEYGVGEIPLTQKDGDPTADQLYTTGFALIALREAVAATNDPKLKQAEDKLAEFLCRIQVRSDDFPYLDGSWFRAFDYSRWDYWASSGDIGWGAWSVESGWGTAWIAAALGLRLKGSSFWDATSGSKIVKHFSEVQELMAQNEGGPWKPE